MAPSPAEQVWSLNLDQIEPNTGRVLAKEWVAPDELGPSAYFFEHGTLLYSKLRPYLNKVVVADAPGYATTELVPLRCDAEVVCAQYLAHFLRSPEFLQFANTVVMSEFWRYEAPLPPLPEQRRIAAILDQADALRAKRREALAQLDRLTQGIFVEMFGDLAGNGWAMSTVESMAKPDKGSIRTGPFGSQLLHSEFVDEGVAVLGIDNAVKNEFRWGESRFISEQKYRELKRYKVFPGDVLITIMGTCGRCAVVPDDIPEAINTKHLCCITLDSAQCLPSFLQAYFLLHPTAREYLGQTAKGAVMDGLNMGIIKGMPVPLVPMALQQTFATRAQAIEALKAQHRAALADLDALFTSLQHRAFRGEL
jgi:type I restriction enzyme S subunit